MFWCFNNHLQVLSSRIVFRVLVSLDLYGAIAKKNMRFHNILGDIMFSYLCFLLVYISSPVFWNDSSFNSPEDLLCF